MPIEDEQTGKFFPHVDLVHLARVLIGLDPVGGDDRVLYPLRSTSGYVNRLMNHAMVHPEFHDALASIHPDDFHIVGTTYRSPDQKSALKKKKQGSLILLVREPGNQSDPNAIMCLAAQSDHSGQANFNWRHVGYLPAKLAKKLAPHWYTIKGVPVIIHATLSAVETPANFTKLSLVNDYSSSVNFRDLSPMFEGILWDADDHPL